MNPKLIITRTFSACMIMVTIITYSMVALAGSERIAGELILNGKNTNGVTVNGEAVKNGNSIFSSSTIETPGNTNAVINVGKLGSIELAPETTLVFSLSENGIRCSLLAGQVTVLNAAESVNITTPDGKVLNLTAGESAGTSKKQDDDDNKNEYLWLWGLLAAGVAGAFIIAIAVDDDDVIVSPIR